MARKKTLGCTKCDRKFSMPAHLARHMKTIHGAARVYKAAGAPMKKGKRRVGRPKGTRIVAGALPAFGGESARLFGDLRAYHGRLLAQRGALDAQLDAITRAIDAFGGARRAPAAPKRKYAKRGRPAGARGVAKARTREGSLKSYILRVLGQASAPLGPRELGLDAIKAGFRTKSKDITKAVSNALPHLAGVKKVGFGKYQLART